MIKKDGHLLTINSKNQTWKASLDYTKVDALTKITFGNDTIAEDIHCSFDEIKANSFNLQNTQDFSKQGVDVVKTRATNPHLTLGHTYRFFNNALRITTDLHIHKGFKLTRRIAIGSLFLPGQWSKMRVTPPIEHQTKGDQPYTIKIGHLPENSLIGHWHQAPLSLVFERKNGKRIQIGTGSDLWRWNKLQAYQDTGSYKVIKEKQPSKTGKIIEGIRILRQPLMTCTPYTPKVASYRFSSFIAWDYGLKKTALPKHNPIELVLDKNNNLHRQAIIEQISKKAPNLISIDMAKIHFPNSAYCVASPLDLVQNIRQNHYCLESKKVYLLIKSLVRKLKNIEQIKGVIFRNLYPEPCFFPGHFNSQAKLGRAHWGINSLLELSAWLRYNNSDNFKTYLVNHSQNSSPVLTGLLNDSF